MSKDITIPATEQVEEKDTSVFKQDLHGTTHSSSIEPSKLTPFQRVILTADGTLTEILEAYLSEKLHVVKLFEGIISITQDITLLDIQAGREIIERKILLQGKESGCNLLYAESIIVPDRLEEKFREKLLNSEIPMGKLWVEHKLETFKEIITSSQEPARGLSDYFKIKKADQLLCRTYRVFSNRQPIMMITEKFPKDLFQNMQ